MTRKIRGIWSKRKGSQRSEPACTSSLWGKLCTVGGLVSFCRWASTALTSLYSLQANMLVIQLGIFLILSPYFSFILQWTIFPFNQHNVVSSLKVISGNPSWTNFMPFLTIGFFLCHLSTFLSISRVLLCTCSGPLHKKHIQVAPFVYLSSSDLSLH